MFWKRTALKAILEKLDGITKLLEQLVGEDDEDDGSGDTTPSSDQPAEDNEAAEGLQQPAGQAEEAQAEQ